MQEYQPLDKQSISPKTTICLRKTQPYSNQTSCHNQTSKSNNHSCLAIKFFHKLCHSFPWLWTVKCIIFIEYDDNQLIFHLNTKKLNIIRSFYDQYHRYPKIQIDQCLLFNLWRTAIVKSSNNIFPAEMIFVTCCNLKKNGKSQYAVRTVIGLDGDIIQQIHRDCFTLTELIEIHAFLVNEIFKHFHSMIRNWIVRIFGILGWFPFFVTSYSQYQDLSAKNLSMIFASFLLPALLTWWPKLRRYVTKWMVRSLKPVIYFLLKQWVYSQLA